MDSDREWWSSVELVRDVDDSSEILELVKVATQLVCANGVVGGNVGMCFLMTDMFLFPMVFQWFSLINRLLVTFQSQILLSNLKAYLGS